MNEFEQSIQHDLDRVGAIIELYYPECKVKRYRDNLIMKKDAFNWIRFHFDNGSGEIGGTASPEIGGIMSLFVQRDMDWLEDAYANVCVQYYSTNPYEAEIVSFRRRYGKVCYFGETMRTLFGIGGIFALCFTLIYLIGWFKSFHPGSSTSSMPCSWAIASVMVAVLFFWLSCLNIKVDYGEADKSDL